MRLYVNNAVPGGASSSRFGIALICRVFLGLLLAVSGTPLASTAAQQDVALAARQERARKQSETTPPGHVYTNDDLARSEILTPADRSRFVAARTPDISKPELQTAANRTPTVPTNASDATSEAPPAFTSGNQASVDGVPLDQLPLGDIARYYRAQRQQEEARTSARATPPAAPGKSFPLMASSTPLASMKRTPERPATPAPSVWPTRARDPFAHTQFAHAQPARVATPQTAHQITAAAVPVAKLQPTRPIIASAVVDSRVAARRISSVRIVEGDTLWSIARKYLGSGYRWKQIVAVNPGVEDPRQLRAGAELVLPARQL